jgi:probable HAF family extracellular repeat protein
MTHLKALASLLLIAIAPVGEFNAAAATASFTEIPANSAAAVSGDGTVVTGEINGQPYLWTASTGVEAIPLPTGQRLFSVSDISGDGVKIVGGLTADSFSAVPRYQGFSWTRGTGFQLLGSLSTDPLDWAYASAVSHDGSVIVGTNDTPNGNRAFRWTEAGGLQSLGHLGSSDPFYPPYSNTGGVSADGALIVGQATVAGDSTGKTYRWTQAEGFDVIGLPSGDNGGLANGGAYAVSGNGQVLVGFSQNLTSWSWAWTQADGFVPLYSRPGNRSSSATSLSFDGSVVGGTELNWHASGAYYEAAVWRKVDGDFKIQIVHGLLQMSGVDLTGWNLTNVTDVSYDGRTIVGNGINPQGQRRAWIAQLPLAVPEPSTAGMMVMAIAATTALLSARRLRPSNLAWCWPRC